MQVPLRVTHGMTIRVKVPGIPPTVPTHLQPPRPPESSDGSVALCSLRKSG